MASESIRAFWNDGVRAERERVMLRISQGTKGASPEIRNVNRMNPGYYFNPLPDNSSGSKIRLFESNKDESGRPNAMEMVAMRQKGMLSGGVLKDFRYAKNILNRRARDTANLDLEAQGLPTVAEPIAELSAIDSRNLELNNLLQGVQDAIESGTASSLTVNELKNIPRLLIILTPSYTPAEAVELIRFIDDDILDILREQNQREPAVVGRLTRFFEAVRKFLDEMMPFLGLDDMTKQRASVSIGKRIFGRQIQLEEVAPQRVQAPIPPPPEGGIPPPPPGGDDEDGDEGDEGDEGEAEAEGPESIIAPASVRGRPQIGQDELQVLRNAYRTKDIETLSAFVRLNTPLRANRYFKSRTTLANAILDKFGADIRRR